MAVNRLDFALIIVACFMVIGIVIAFMYSDGHKCQINPFIYGASKLKNVECSCVQYSNPTCPPRFTFNDTSFDAPVTRCGSYTGNVDSVNIKDLNLSVVK